MTPGERRPAGELLARLRAEYEIAVQLRVQAAESGRVAAELRAQAARYREESAAVVRTKSYGRNGGTMERTPVAGDRRLSGGQRQKPVHQRVRSAGQDSTSFVERQRTAHERERIVHERERVADKRDLAANQRDLQADRRDQAVVWRERTLDELRRSIQSTSPGKIGSAISDEIDRLHERVAQLEDLLRRHEIDPDQPSPEGDRSTP
jgi:hypothetical protein